MIIHDNIWKWGRALTIVLAGGKAMCRVSIDNEDGRAWLDNVIVHESIRNQNYGTRLLGHAYQEAKKLGCDALWLFVDGPEWVQEWYERNGYFFQNDAFRFRERTCGHHRRDRP